MENRIIPNQNNKKESKDITKTLSTENPVVKEKGDISDFFHNFGGAFFGLPQAMLHQVPLSEVYNFRNSSYGIAGFLAGSLSIASLVGAGSYIYLDGVIHDVANGGH